jgi:hypothetical protein
LRFEPTQADFDYLANKHPHLSVVLIFKEHSLPLQQSRALYRSLTPGQAYEANLIHFKPLNHLASNSSEARILQTFSIRSRRISTASFSSFCHLAVEASRAFYRPFFSGQEEKRNLFSSLLPLAVKRRRAFYRV